MSSKNLMDKSSTASHLGGLFDDRASVLGLINFFERAINSGVLSAAELLSRGIDLMDVRRTI